MKRRTVHRVCTLCEATCGLAIEVEGRRVLAIHGDADDPFSRGHMCAKAPALADVQEDPDRLRRPVKRTDAGFVEISWEEAFDLAAEGLLAARQQGGADAIALYYSGNPVVSAPDSDRLDAALGLLDVMVSIDFYLNETTRHADVILPPAGPLKSGYLRSKSL